MLYHKSQKVSLVWTCWIGSIVIKTSSPTKTTRTNLFLPPHTHQVGSKSSSHHTHTHIKMKKWLSSSILLFLVVVVLTSIPTVSSFQPSLPFVQKQQQQQQQQLYKKIRNNNKEMVQVKQVSNSNQGKVVNSLPSWDPTNWTPQRLHNSPLFRSGAILGALALAGVSSRSPLAQMSKKAAVTTHLLAFGTWFGTMMYTTFIAGITMYRNLPRQTFGKLQSKLFPQYFFLCSASIVLQVRIHTHTHKQTCTHKSNAVLLPARDAHARAL